MRGAHAAVNECELCACMRAYAAQYVGEFVARERQAFRNIYSRNLSLASDAFVRLYISYVSYV